MPIHPEVSFALCAPLPRRLLLLLPPVELRNLPTFSRFGQTVDTISPANADTFCEALLLPFQVYEARQTRVSLADDGKS